MKTAKDKVQYLDCIALKRRIQRQIYAETKGMAPLERLAYYHKLVEESPFAALLKQRREKTPEG
jgi:hypothetical protein